MRLKAVFLLFLLAVSINQAQGHDLRWLLENEIISTLVEKLVTFVVNLFPPIITTTPKDKIKDEYDFVVVGSGPAGSVVARRLSDIMGWNVLVLEAGKPESWIASVPILAPLMQWTPYNWGYKMEKQDNACKAMVGGRCAWPRGKALGGSSVINYMIYTRGNKEEFNLMERNGNTGWNYMAALKTYKKMEKHQLNVSLIDKDYHGGNGTLHTEHTYGCEVTDAVLQAGNGNKTAFDYNGKYQMVFSKIQGTVNKGGRDSAAKAYLIPAMKRNNLHILTEAHVTKIIIDDNNVARGVEYLYRGKRYTVRATKEVIVSAGTINSPQLLMLSGIGPKEELQKFNITVKLDQQWVGRNMQDHIAYIGLTMLFDKKYDKCSSFLNPKTIMQWLLTGKGPLSSLVGVSGLGFMKTHVADYVEDIPDIELMLINMGGFNCDYGWVVRKVLGITDEFYNSVMSEPTRSAGMIVPMLLKPKSRGHLELQSANPLVPVKIYANYFNDTRDKQTLIAGINRSVKIINSEPLRQLGARLSNKRIPECLVHRNQTDYLSCALEYLCHTIYHPTGTCKMGPSSDKQAVVGPDLKVHNVGNLRVIDASIIPDSIAGHTCAPSYLIGENGADLIKNEHLIKNM